MKHLYRFFLAVAICSSCASKQSDTSIASEKEIDDTIPQDMPSLNVDSVNLQDAVLPETEQDTFADVQEGKLNTPLKCGIDIPEFNMTEDGFFDFPCCDGRLRICRFVEMPRESFFDSIHALCVKGNVEDLSSHEGMGAEYRFPKGTSKGWVKSNSNTDFSYAEIDEGGLHVNMYLFTRGQLDFSVTTHYCFTLH